MMAVRTLTGFGENIIENAKIYAKGTVTSFRTKEHNLCFDEDCSRFRRSTEVGHR